MTKRKQKHVHFEKPSFMQQVDLRIARPRRREQNVVVFVTAVDLP